MEKKIKVAVMGATGAVGQVFMWMLADHPWFDLAYPIASEARVGKTYASQVHWVIPVEMPEAIKDKKLQKLDADQMKAEGIQIVFSGLPADIANDVEPMLRSKGFYVFSNAASMRYDVDVPILIPEANHEQLPMIEQQGYPNGGFVVTNANCSTTGLAMALAPLKKFGIKTIHVSTYQAVSGAGYPGLSTLDIFGTCIPYIGKEEEKIDKEIKKILSINPEVYPFTIRVPVIVGHLETVWVDFEQDVEPEDIIKAWKDFKECADLPSTPAQPVVYCEDPTMPQQKLAFWGKPQGMVTYTGRCKKKDGKIGFVLMVNNIVKGAAGGSIQNAEAFVARYLNK